METTRSPRGVPAAPPARGDGGGITRHSKDQLVMTGQNGPMSHPAYDDRPREHPDVESVETQYVIHSSLTTTLHYERGFNAYDAFGKWARRHGLTGRVMAGKHVKSPLRHLSIALQTDAGRELHDVHVTAEKILGGGDARS